MIIISRRTLSANPSVTLNKELFSDYFISCATDSIVDFFAPPGVGGSFDLIELCNSGSLIIGEFTLLFDES